MNVNDIGQMRVDFARKTDGLIIPNRAYLTAADYHTVRLDRDSVYAFHTVGRDQFIFGMKIYVITGEKTYLAYDPFLEN